MKNESIHILNFNENFNEIEEYDVLNIEQRIRDIALIWKINSIFNLRNLEE